MQMRDACVEYTLNIVERMLITHAIPCAMSGFRTELLTSAVYCYFLQDREAIQMPKFLYQKMC